MSGFLDSVTAGNVSAWRVVGLSLALALFGLQVLLGVDLWTPARSGVLSGGSGAAPLEAVPARVSAGRAHRWTGRIAVGLYVLVVLTYLFGPLPSTSTPTIIFHAVFDAAMFGLLAAKLSILRLGRGRVELVPYLGFALFVALAAVWLVSISDYIARGSG